jgi:homocysteine S-methyltransferase
MASAEDTLVAASVGPYGAALNDGSEFRGGYGVRESDLRDFHARRLDILLDTEPDLLAIETQPELQEIDVLLALLEELATDIPFWVSCTVSEVGRIAGGAPWEEVVSRVSESDNAIAVGINCSSAVLIGDTLQTASTNLPYVVYPNHGREWNSATESWVGAGHDVTVAHLAEWHGLGVRMVGGCCGFDARAIASLGKSLHKFDLS